MLFFFGLKLKLGVCCTGTLPLQYMKLPLRTFKASNNLVTGMLPRKFPRQKSVPYRCASTEKNSSEQLKWVACAGTLPAEYGSLRYLKELWLDSNMINGKSL